MKLILSPAKLMHAPLNRSETKPILHKHAKALMSSLKDLSVSELTQLMKLSGPKANETHELLQNWGKKSKQKNTTAAIDAYIGEAFKALDVSSVTPAELRYLQDQLFILSGLYGVLRPLDGIEPYRLEMAQRGIAPNGMSLYAFWREKVEKILRKELIKNENILNLASAEYADLISDKGLRDRMLTPHFFELQGGQLKAVSVFSKQARGTMARWCATQQIAEPEQIKAFDALGYRFSEAHSSIQDLVFVR